MTIGVHDHVQRIIKASWQEIEGETVVLVSKEQRLLGFNAVAGRIWQLADGSRPIMQIVEMIATEFDASKERIQNDSIQFVKHLVERGLLELKAR